MTFQKGDRVIITAVRLGEHQKYVDVVGTVIRPYTGGGAIVIPDAEYKTADRPCHADQWWFSGDHFTLELFNEETLYTPEDWS